MRVLARCLLAESLGTGLLVAVVVGSGIAAQQLSPGDPGLQLLENSTATVLGLGVLIVVLAPVSGAHLNPVVTAAEWFLNRSRSLAVSVLYVCAQVGGAIAGAVVTNAMFAVPQGLSVTHRVSWQHGLAEGIATAVLVLVIFGLTRAGEMAIIPIAVAAYIGAAYWFTSSTSFANPAVTIGRTFSDSFAGIAPASVPGFIAAQIAGGVVGVLLVETLYPVSKGSTMAGSESACPSVLFACRANAGRSVTARLLAEYYGAGRIDAYSAGSEPGNGVHPEITSALATLGLDTSSETPKPFDPDARYDAVITMGCGETCPFYPGASYEDWPVADPKGQPAEVVRGIIADVDARVRTLMERLLPGADLRPSLLSAWAKDSRALPTAEEPLRVDRLPGEGIVQVDIEVPPAQATVLDALEARAGG